MGGGWGACQWTHTACLAAQAIYEVEDLQTAISNVAQTQLKDVFGKMSFTHALESQEIINTHMQRSFAKTFIKWGINVHRIELQDLRPKSSAFF